MGICLFILMLSVVTIVHDQKQPFKQNTMNNLMSLCYKIIILTKIITLCEIEDIRK